MDWLMYWRRMRGVLRDVSAMLIIVFAAATLGWGLVNILFGITLIYNSVLRMEEKLSAVDAACVVIRKDQEQTK